MRTKALISFLPFLLLASAAIGGVQPYPQCPGCCPPQLPPCAPSSAPHKAHTAPRAPKLKTPKPIR